MNAWNRYKASQDFEEWLQVRQQERNQSMQILVVPQSEMFVQASAAEISVVERDPRCMASTSIKQVTNWVRSRLGLRPEPVMPVEDRR